jgi:hypothetical protein
MDKMTLPPLVLPESREGHAIEPAYNLLAEDVHGRVFILDWPTMINEYEPDEVQVLMRVMPGANTFIALDYSSPLTLRSVLAAVARNAPPGRFVLEKRDGAFCPLESWESLGEDF